MLNLSANSLNIFLLSGESEKIHMAAMLASVAAVSDQSVNVFVSMEAVYSFVKDQTESSSVALGKFAKTMSEKGAPDALELFRQGKMLGSLCMRMCSMAMDIHGWDEEDLAEDLFDEPAGVAKFLLDAENGQMITI